MPRAGDQVLGDRGSAPARGIGRVAVAAGGQLRVRVTKSPEPSHPRLSPARMIGARTPSGGPAQCRQHVQRGAATAGRHRRRSATAANLIRAQHMVRGCQAAAMAPPDRAAGRLTPLCGRRKEPHPTISPSGPFLFDLDGKRGYIGMCSQPAPHICIVASQLRRVRVTYNKLTLMPPPTPVPKHFRTEKQLTAPADRPVRDPAHAVAFSTGVAAGFDRTGPGSPPPNSPSQNRPTSPVNHIRCSADHRPAWRRDAGPDVRRAVGVCMMGRARGSHLTSAIWQGTLCPKKEVKMILKEPHARAA